MANAAIYAEHHEILNEMITSGNVSDVEGATVTGPFKTMRDAYIFAATIGVAIKTSTPIEKMKESVPKKSVKEISPTVLLGAEGATELVRTIALVDGEGFDTVRESLKYQLDCLADLAGCISVLNRYAHAGFCWLAERRADEAGIRDLIFCAINEIETEKHDSGDDLPIRDPMLDLLGMQLEQ